MNSLCFSFRISGPDSTPFPAPSPTSGGVFDRASLQRRLDEIEKKLSQPGAWDHPEKLTPDLREKRLLSERLELWNSLDSAHSNVQEWMAMAEEERSQEALEALNEALDLLETTQENVELETLLSGPGDENDAILEIHPGAGGTEAQDWAEMLLRMYRRWADDRGLKVDVLDFLPGEEAGIKSITLQIAGPRAYGLLHGEKGIHRLIRISPFDASGRRHTSFASVDVYPQAGQDIKIEVREEDLRIDTFRSSGPGGQSVNTTSSAVRITHMPSGIVVQCQDEKSQLRNKESAMKILKARLYDRELQKIQDERQAEYDSKNAIAWGSQIRTYTLQPYQLVKDHRTGHEEGNVDAVLNGRIDPFIKNYLLTVHDRS